MLSIMSSKPLTLYRFYYWILAILLITHAMNSRSYVRILNNKRSEHANQFTTVATPIKQMSARRRRRLKDKKKTEQSTKHVPFDEPSIPSTSPTKIIQRTPTKPPMKQSKSPLPSKRTINQEHFQPETHRTAKPNHTATITHNLGSPNGSKPRSLTKHRPRPIQTVQSTTRTSKTPAFSAQFMTNGFPSASGDSMKSIESIKAIKHNGHRSTDKDNTLMKSNTVHLDDRSMIEDQMHKQHTDRMNERNKMDQFMAMLDGMDTDDIFNAFVGYKRNYDFPKQVCGIYKSFTWDHTIDHDNNSWDMILNCK
eukprot:249907_1